MFCMTNDEELIAKIWWICSTFGSTGPDFTTTLLPHTKHEDFALCLPSCYVMPKNTAWNAYQWEYKMGMNSKGFTLH